MVKRKAEISLVEWLVQGVRRPKPTTAKTTKAPVGQPHNQGTSLVETASEARAAQSATAKLAVGPLPVDSDPSRVTGAKGEAHDWFWLLLEQAGYERW